MFVHAMRLFIVSAVLASVACSMALSVPLDRRQESGGCKKINLLYARGTGEGGTMGGSVGPKLSNALVEKFGKENVKTEGVSYPADVNGATSGAINPRGSPGSKAMAEMAKTAFKSCPKTNVVLSGYSQGAEQVHGALMNLGAEGNKITVRILILCRS
jgi:cutinase